HLQGGRFDRLSAAGTTAGPHPVSGVQDHGRLRSADVGTGLGGVLSERNRPHRAKSAAALGGVFQLPPALYSDTHRLVHGPGGASTLDVLWRLADRRRMTPSLTTGAAAFSLIVYCLVYSFIFAFGPYYISRLLPAGPAGRLILPPA